MRMKGILLAGLVALIPSVAAADTYDRVERRALRQRMIEQFDADGDGRLTGPERRAARRAMTQVKRQHQAERRVAKRARRFDRIVARMDADGDGVIGPGEAGARLERLRRFDLDGDGWVTKQEFVRGRRGPRGRRQ